MKRQLGQAEWKHHRIRPFTKRDERDGGERDADGGARGEQHAHDTQIARTHEPERADREPCRNGGGDQRKRGGEHRCSPRTTVT